MNYIIDREHHLYIIRLNNLNNEIFEKIINDILEKRGVKDKLYSYYTFFNRDYTYCILDFKKRKFSEENVDEIVNAYVKKK